MPPTLSLKLLGSYAIVLNDQPVEPMPRSLARALLARLALSHPIAQPRSDMIADLLPHAPEDRAARNLRSATHDIRRSIGTLLLSDDHHIGLAPELGIRHDVDEFITRTRSDATLIDLLAAIDLYQGPFLGSPTHGWGAMQARLLHQRFLDALQRAVRLAGSLGETDQYVRAALRWFKIEPWSDAARDSAVAALRATGRHADASAIVADVLVIDQPSLAILDRPEHRAPWRDVEQRDAPRWDQRPPSDQRVPIQRSSDSISDLRFRPGDNQAAGWPDELFEPPQLSIESFFQHTNHALMQRHFREALEWLQRIDAMIDGLELSALDPRHWQRLELRERYYHAIDDFDARARTIDAMLALADNAGRADWLADALIRRGMAARQHGHATIAEQTLRQAAMTARGEHLPVTEATARMNLSRVLSDRGDTRTALLEAEAAVDAALRAGDTEGELCAKTTLAGALLNGGETAAADALLSHLLTFPLVSAHSALEARLYRQLGIVRMSAGEYDAALSLLRAAVRAAQRTPDSYLRLVCQASLAFELSRLGMHNEARTIAGLTIELAQQLDTRLQWSVMHSILSQCELQAGAVQQARDHAYQGALNLHSTGHRLHEAAAQLQLAAVYLEQGSISTAAAVIEHVTQLLADQDDTALIVDHIAAQIEWALGNHARAEHHARIAAARALEEGSAALDTIEPLWAAAEVLLNAQQAALSRSLVERAHHHLLEQLGRMRAPHIRRSFVAATKAHRALASIRGARRLAWLPLYDTAHQRTTDRAALFPVIWTIDAADDPQSPAERRHQQILRVVDESITQGAIATIDALADALSVSRLIVIGDVRSLKQRGYDIQVIGL